MSDRPRTFKRKAPGGYKRKIVRLQAEIAELRQSLAESEERSAHAMKALPRLELTQSALRSFIRDILPCEYCPAFETAHCDDKTNCDLAIETAVFDRLAAFEEDKRSRGY